MVAFKAKKYKDRSEAIDKMMKMMMVEEVGEESDRVRKEKNKV